MSCLSCLPPAKLANPSITKLTKRKIPGTVHCNYLPGSAWVPLNYVCLANVISMLSIAVKVDSETVGLQYAKL